MIGVLGYRELPDYLRDRHVGQHRTVNQIAAEVGMSYHSVESALRRHGLAKVTYAAKRHSARERESQVAAALGYPRVADYVAQRRAAGWTWASMSAETGQPQTWLRRHSQSVPDGRESGRQLPELAAELPGSCDGWRRPTWTETAAHPPESPELPCVPGDLR